MRIAEELKELLQNITGKEISTSPTGIAEVMHEYNKKYVCAVTFSTTPATATVVVKKGTAVLTPSEGVYYLKEGSYTYTASAEGYTTKSNQSFSISNADETTGSKTITVTLVEA